MKRIDIKYMGLIAGLMMAFSSCADLLNQEPTVDLPATNYWKTESDAESALNGLVSDIRWLFNRDYYLDGMGEFVRVRGNSFLSEKGRDGRAYKGLWEINPVGYGGGWSEMYRYCYGGINRVNYVIDNVEKMIANTSNEKTIRNLEGIIGECKLMRALVYFRLIMMWGDVPYIDWRVYDNSEVENLPRTPLAKVKDHILDDLQDAFLKLPEKATVHGRFAQPAALALRGKVLLYWASWNHYGWPELDTFTPNASESAQAYKDAAADFKKAIEESGISLFRNGEPGDWGEMGGCEVLPNYFYLFLPTANADPELMVGFTHGGTGTGQGEELMRDFGTRATEGSQGWGQPRAELANRYQSTVTGDFCEKLIPKNPADTDARTAVNSALNPESYKDRDYRMKSTLLWDGETMVTMLNLSFDQIRKYQYKALQGSVDGYGAINADGDQTGYIMRKFVRNYAGQGRSDGDYHMPIMRLADVYLMYAEAANEAYGPTGDGGLALDVVNRVRHRGNLPALKPEKYADKLTFFYAIEQERIVELFAEGQRLFDLRRWRSIERVFLPPQTSPGVRMYDTHGALRQTVFNNTSLLNYQRNYIFRIPPSERNKNPNLTQNTPWL